MSRPADADLRLAANQRAKAAEGTAAMSILVFSPEPLIRALVQKDIDAGDFWFLHRDRDREAPARDPQDSTPQEDLGRPRIRLVVSNRDEQVPDR
jgi:hypothetical protein